MSVHPIGIAWAAGTLFMVVAELASWIERVKNPVEGPLEHISHVTVLGAAVLWLWTASRIGRGDARRWAALGAGAYLVLLFFEEIDWGAVYDITVISGLWQRWFGVFSFHETTVRSTSMFLDKLAWFGIPLVLWMIAPLLPFERVQRWCDALQPVLPTPTESRWFFVIVGSYALLDGFFQAYRVDYTQLLVYALFGMSAWRAGRAL